MGESKSAENNDSGRLKKGDVEIENKKNAADINNSTAVIEDASDLSNKEGKQKINAARKKAGDFAWKDIGFWNREDKYSKEKALHYSKLAEAYIVDHLYNDWYWNTSIVVGTCFFSWLVARIGGGIFSFAFILLFTSSVYRSEFRRFTRNLKDDMTRIVSNKRLGEELETMEWLNSFMDKFWVIYMPALSDQVMFQANQVLKDQAPGYGIDALSLAEFTLGSKAPRIESIKTYTEDDGMVNMDWKFAFAPNDTDDMTKNEILKKINPKVALGVTVGKAFVSKTLPILVEDMSFKGRMNIKLKLSQNFPHVKIVSVQFLEPPDIDYVLKPVGGDTFGLDIMSLIPGLSSFVNGIIHSNLRPMLYAPNSLDVDVEEILAKNSNDASSLLAVTVKKCIDLKSPDKGIINPYVVLKVDNNAAIEEKTKIKKAISNPIFMERKLLLLNQLEKNFLTFEVYNFITNKAEDVLIGTARFELSSLLQRGTRNNEIKPIVNEQRVMGKIQFDLNFSPTLKEEKLEDGTKTQGVGSDFGILKFILNEAKDLDISNSAVGLLNPYAEIYLDNKLMKKTRVVRQNNQPSWAQSFETLVPRLSESKIEVVIKDTVEDQIVGRINLSTSDIIFEYARGQEWHEGDCLNKDTKPAQIRMSAKWKPLSITDESVHFFKDAPIGGIKLQVLEGENLMNLEAFGAVDPYLRIFSDGKVISKSSIFSDNLSPKFNHICYIPVDNISEYVLIEVVDQEEEAADRSLGTCAIRVRDFVDTDENGYFIPKKDIPSVLEQPVLFDGRNEGILRYAVTFFPTLPVFSFEQRENKEKYFEYVKEKEHAIKCQQAKDEEIYNKNPNDYQWVESGFVDTIFTPRKDLPLERLVSYDCGVMTVKIMSGSFNKSDVYVHILFDENMYPSGTSSKSDGPKLDIISTTEAFIRDLRHSKIIFRLSRKFDVEEQKDVLCEKIFNTLDLLEKGYHEPIVIQIDSGNSVKAHFDFTPSDVKLPRLDTVEGTGTLHAEITGGSELKAVDSNGKADPFAVFNVDGIEVFKTKKKRKTLSPTWNESFDTQILSRVSQPVLLQVFDWDLTHERELIGSGIVDLSGIEPNTRSPLTVELEPQGKVDLFVTFKPEYVRPELKSRRGLPLEFESLAGVSSMAVGGVTAAAGGISGVAGNTVGAGFSAANDGFAKGGSLMKGLMRKKKQQNDSSDLETQASSPASNHSSPSSSPSSKGRVVKTPSTARDDSSINVARHPVKQSFEMQSQASMRNEPFLPPKSTFTDAKSTDVTSIASSYKGSDFLPGRITILEGNMHNEAPLEIRIVLRTQEKDKVIHKSKVAKSNNSVYKWNDTLPFKAPPTGSILLIVREHHIIGKNVTVGEFKVDLQSVLNNSENQTLEASFGKLVVNIRYYTPGV